MEQSKLESKIEVAANYISGFLIAWLTLWCIVNGPVAWGIWNFEDDKFQITMTFTVVSVARTYFWRRFFARGFHRVVHLFLKRVLKWQR